MCVLILEWRVIGGIGPYCVCHYYLMCPHSCYVSSLLYHKFTILRVSSYYMCPHPAIYVCPHYYILVLILARDLAGQLDGVKGRESGENSSGE